MTIPWMALGVSFVALAVALIALYRTGHTDRRVMLIPPPCQHKWKNIHTTDRLTRWGHSVGYIHTLQCTTCGDIEFREFNLPGHRRAEY